MIHVLIRRSILTALLAGAAILSSCSSSQKLGEEVQDLPPPVGYKPPVYITGDVAYDSTNPNKVMMDVYKIDADGYPNDIKLYARVFDSSGRFVHGMAPPYYKGKDDYKKLWDVLTEAVGKKAPAPIGEYSVREFGENDEQPYAIALTLDHSGSMGDRIYGLQNAAVKFIEKMHKNDKLSVIKFDNRVNVEVPLGDKASCLALFQKTGLKGYGGYTALYQAAHEGIEQIKNADSAQLRVLVIFTDGEDNASRISDEQLYHEAKDNNIHIFTIGFGFINDLILRNLAAKCGGKYYHAYTTDELYNVFEDIYRSLRNYYLVDYKPPYYNGRHVGHIELQLPGAAKPLAADYQYDKFPMDNFFTAIGDMRTEPILFDFNKAVIRDSASWRIIDEWGEFMHTDPTLRIEVRGNTDNVGTDDYNQKLSEARADAVRDALIARGVEQERLRTRGFGASQPIAPNDTEENRQRNRRTEFVVIGK